MPTQRCLVVTALLAALVSQLPLGRVGSEPTPAGEGKVVAIDQAASRITLDHGPIPGVMPAMRMAFPVQEANMLRRVQVGDAVRFTVSSRGPEWVIVTLEPVAPASAPVPARFPAPDFSLRVLDGGVASLSSWRGKAILLNFWATWCVPCRTEMPTIERLYQRYRDQGLAVVAINLDTLSTAGVEAFLKEVKVTFPILLDADWSTTQAYRVLGLPTTYLIDREGNVVIREIGARDWDDPATHAAVTKLLE